MLKPTETDRCGSSVKLQGRCACQLLLAAALLSWGSAVLASGGIGEKDEDGTDANGTRSFEIYGFAQLDYIQDFKRVDPDWEAALRPSKIPTIDGLFGDNGVALLSVRQSTFGVKAAIPAGNQEITTQFEFDLFGVGDNAGQTTFRLRQAWGAWGPILAGQTNSLFTDGDLFPNIVDYWGPTGMAFSRNPQIRVTLRDSGGVKFAVAIEQPNTDIDIGNIRELDPALGANLRPTTPLPDLTAQFRLTGKWGSLQVSGLLTKIGYDTVGTPGNEPSDTKIGGGVNVGAMINAGAATVFRVGVVYGHGVASYMNDGGTDLAPQTTGGIPALVAKAVPLLGVTAYVDHNWSPKFSSALGYSITKVWNTDFQALDAYKSGQYASTNLMWKPVKNVMMAGELLWGKRTDNGGATGDDIRTQISFRYTYSSGNVLNRK